LSLGTILRSVRCATSDPAAGRFITRDPIGKSGGSNEYAYTGNNPVTRNDPFGLSYSGNASSAPSLSPREQGKMALAAFVHVITDGNYDGGKYRCDPDWGLMTAIMGYVWGVVQLDTGGLSEVGVMEEEAVECGLAGGGCFLAGTSVQMADGSTKPIEQVKAGDTVISRNEKTGKTEPEKVTETVKHYNVPTLTLTFSNGEKIVTTGVHPFYVQGKGFVEAGYFAVGNAIIARAGPAAAITKIEQTAPETVYNLTVDNDHTYFVGSKDGGLWVHNAKYCEGEVPAEDTLLYRGVARRTSKGEPNPAYEPATNGEAYPRNPNSHIDVYSHNLENTDSKWTSWTTNRSVAVESAKSDGVVLENVFQPSEMTWSPDAFDEDEILIEGPVTGATVTTP